MSQENNQRVRLTKTLLQNALIELLQEKTISKISVRELCEKAGINRSTFYLHYESPSDVLSDIGEMLIQDISSVVSTSCNTSDRTDTFRHQVCIICHYLLEHRQTAATLFRVNTPESEFAGKMLSLRIAELPGFKGFLNKHDETSADLIQTYITNGVFSVIRRWLLEDIRKTPEQISELASELLPQIRTEKNE